MGNLKYFLGIELVRYSNGINIYLKKYALDLLNNASVLEGEFLH